jgi:predicted transcriptional regulator
MTNSPTKPTTKSKPAQTSRVTKKNQLIKLLGTKSGADIKTLSEKLGWQQHTTRAAMSGLRKAGYEVTGEKPAKGGMSKFRILSVPTEPRSAAAEVAAHGA